MSKMGLFIVMSFVGIVLAGCSHDSSKVSNVPTPEKQEKKQEMVTNEPSKKQESMKYVAYDKTQLSESVKEGKKAILFFYASRCPTCRSLDKEIISNQSQIPEDVIIYKVNYDASIDLKKQYGVVTQHTLVYLDSNLSKKSSHVGARDLDQVLQGLQ